MLEHGATIDTPDNYTIFDATTLKPDIIWPCF